MAMAKAGSSADLSDIQRRMAQIRHEMHEEVQGAVRGAQSLTDWRSMVADHPWGALGIAAAVGYLVVPHRRSRDDGGSAAHLAATVAAVSQAEAARRGAGRPVGKSSLVRSAFSLLTPVLIRAAQNYALNQVEQWLLAPPFRLDVGNRDSQGGPGGAGPGDEDAEAQTVRFRDPR
jgi:hypothetical protein